MTHVRRSSDNGFEVRIVVPAALRERLGKANLTRRLGRISKSNANRHAGPIIAEFLGMLAEARNGSSERRSIAESALKEVTRRSSTTTSLRTLFQGYVAERQPSPATVKRWEPVFRSLSKHLGHDDASQITSEQVVSWKEALQRQGVSPRTIREVYLAAVKVVFSWSVENRKLASNGIVRANAPPGKEMRAR